MLNSKRHINLKKSVELTALGHTYTEHVLRYFVRKAISSNYFVGLKEEELRGQILQGDNLGGIYQLKINQIQQALKHKDWVEHNGVSRGHLT